MPESIARSFDPACRRCTRLAVHLTEMRARYPGYHNGPVAAFGDPDTRLLIVGLAPGAHGANRTGRPFTGDHAGNLLYRALHEIGLATLPVSRAADDGLRLLGCRITNAVKCLPPANRPTTAEMDRCNDYLLAELDSLGSGAVILALGGIAHRAVLRAYGLTLSAYRFGHDELHALPNGRVLLDSYHCSRYNTQTGRLTAEMFVAALARAKALAIGL
ncbi:uracil-DNA glycosylase [Candidatus Rariloculus sp.]|uniref:uracil-DNA glycosylase n=1 Tax=Candidatus Rariloculus sp. TaxID=3101265 RepID=UPI003D0999AE